MTYKVKNYFRSLIMVLSFSAPLALADDAPRTALSVDAASELLFQLEALQTEVQTLRGIVEQQQYELSKMKDSQKDRYIDLDKRVSLVMSRMSETTTNADNSVNDVSVTIQSPTDGDILIAGDPAISETPSNTSSDPIVIQPTTPEIQEAYKASYDLIRNKEYERAAAAFEQFVEDHPSNELTGNGYYWLGQLKLVLGDPANALTQFDTVVNRFPGHNKESDAIYKLGLVNDQLGNKIAAKRHLIDVIERFPVSDAAKLAKKYLSTMK
ncbi:tol-pal system protein YbgF [Marinomonas agarivorans]|nr:tol-pal system protein YbgF [Marinomonas agarivorans]